MPLSYEETRLEILDSLYIHLIQNANNDQILRSSLDYLIYDFESNYSKAQRLLINFCIFVLAENLFQDFYVSKLLKSDITQSIPFNLRHLMNQLEGEDRECFITDFRLMGFAID
ncbi:conserved hypothetical protein [Enhydrobacter sp. 8BJ]|nr:conserved hypothetical protein [Moraxellaceae bacterium 17A]VXA96129.1 conserved hypothetical protein [Enhydrobacter sp. 8BJ]